MLKQTVLPFKLEMTNDLITSHVGLVLLGEFAVGLGLNKALGRYLPGPGSGVGYLANEHVFPLILMLKNELPRRKQRGIIKSVERPKGRGI
jgi:hypothetical protein